RPYELCGFDLRQHAKSCGGYGDIEGLYYLVPSMCISEGLKKVFTDDEVRRMADLTVNTSLEDLSIDEERKWDDYVAKEEVTEEKEGSDVDEHAEDGGYDEPTDTSDDEYHAMWDNVKDYNQQILELVEKLRGNESDYLDSDAKKDTPPESEEDDISLETRRLNRRLIIGADTDFREFKWQVGQRFATRSDFREVVTKYGVYQGRNVSIVISDKARQQRLGVMYGEGCSFMFYANWESRRATNVVNIVVPEYTCVKNMERNKQLKSSWMAKQLLDVFKARAHWPAKEIIECIRMAYRVMVERAYKVKYRAHKLLHGSMKEHYSKVGRGAGSLREEEGEKVVIQVREGEVVQVAIQVGEGAMVQLQLVVVQGQGVVVVVLEDEHLFPKDMKSFMLQMALHSLI
ncbi:50S ribosomal protein L34, partial [Bienertia sinuspersici]